MASAMKIVFGLLTFVTVGTIIGNPNNIPIPLFSLSLSSTPNLIIFSIVLFEWRKKSPFILIAYPLLLFFVLDLI